LPCTFSYFILQNSLFSIRYSLKILRAYHFNSLQSVLQKPSHLEALTYDNQPEEDEKFYRVQLNRNGLTPQYSALFVLNFRKLADFEVFPNAAREYIDINIEAAERGKEIGVVFIFMDGKIAKYEKFVEPKSKTVRLELDNIED
jgi:hypothetical protein